MSSPPDMPDLAVEMADAIAFERGSRRTAPVGRDGRQRFTPQMLMACYRLDAAEKAFREAVGQPYVHTQPFLTEAEALDAMMASKPKEVA